MFNRLANKLRKIAARSGYWSFDDSTLEDADAKTYDKAYDKWRKMAETKHKELEKGIRAAVDALETPVNDFKEKIRANEDEKIVDEVDNYIDSPFWYADSMMEYLGKKDFDYYDGLLREDFEEYPVKMTKALGAYKKLVGDKYGAEIEAMLKAIETVAAELNKMPSKEDPPMQWQEPPAPAVEHDPGQGKLF